MIKLGKTVKTKLSTFVVASGLMYGAGEEIFHGNQPALQCYGNGQNIVPIIHVHDLASALVNIADNPPKVRYLIAKDDSQSPLDEIVKVGRGHGYMIVHVQSLMGGRQGVTPSFEGGFTACPLP